jgi:hypothetical protein
VPGSVAQRGFAGARGDMWSPQAWSWITSHCARTDAVPFRWRRVLTASRSWTRRR